MTYTEALALHAMSRNWQTNWRYDFSHQWRGRILLNPKGEEACRAIQDTLEMTYDWGVKY